MMRAQNPVIVLDYNQVKQVFLAQYRNIEVPDEVWHEILGYTQKPNQSVDDFVMQFTRLWDKWARALGNETPPAMLKKDHFGANFKEILKFKVKLKRPVTFEEAVTIARKKEWKAQRLNEYGRTAPVHSDGGQNGENQAEARAQSAQRVANAKQLQRNMQDMMTMMQELQLNVLGGGGDGGRGGGGGHGYPADSYDNRCPYKGYRGPREYGDRDRGSSYQQLPFIIIAKKSAETPVKSSVRHCSSQAPQEGYEYSFKVEDNVRAQLANILTHRINEKNIKVTNVKSLPPPPTKILLDAYTLFFDGAFRKATGKTGGGLVLVSPKGEVVAREQVILEGSTRNNEAEYDVLVNGLKMSLDQRIHRLMVKVDALLIVKQILGIWAYKNERLRSNVTVMRKLCGQFQELQIYHISRKENEDANLLAQYAITVQDGVQVDMAPKKQVARSAISVDFSCNELRKWDLDIYGLDGAQFHNVYLFIAKKEDDSMFEDVGQVVASVSKSDSHPEVSAMTFLFLIIKNFNYLQQHMELNAWPATKKRQCFLEDGRLKDQL
ncbi:hypothetical protein L7F22_065420 [Adiantum nelumboides]|nr:hypothetical protein [Adiantum nelumboides]